ncbi:MAG: aminoacyl-tRNA hydrolase [Neisseriaceae bacterium]|nr:aminoacyl-tRNA hydrolase [Neisseriaceae bacterium]
MIPIKLIVGLGNIGLEYAATRHNAGFMFIDELAYRYHANLHEEKKFFCDLARTTIGKQEVRLIKPNTFMNRSGQAVLAVANFYRIVPEEILVIHDELDIPCGTLKLKQGGGNGGHNGLKDIQARLGSANFWRLRIGISHPGDKNKVVSYVLKKPTSDEQTLIDNSILRAIDKIETIVQGDFAAAMCELHQKI